MDLVDRGCDNDDGALEGTDPEKAKEWHELEITFTWEAGAPTLNVGSVTVSYHPVTDDAYKDPAFCQLAPPSTM